MYLQRGAGIYRFRKVHPIHVVEIQPLIDAVGLREIVATEVREGVAAAGRDRWSSELLPNSIEMFCSLLRLSRLLDQQIILLKALQRPD
jgi:hypothetical protein